MATTTSTTKKASTVACKEQNDRESFAGREYAERNLSHDGRKVVSCCNSCGEKFPFAITVDADSAAYCAGCVGVEE